MKKILKTLGIILGIIVLAIAGLLAYAKFTPMKTFAVKPVAVKITTDSASLAFGEKIVLNVCAHCHLGNDGKLSGRLFNRKEDPFGEMWTANITQHATKGIGRYSDGELAYLIRTGINRDGRFVGNMMCHPQMSDEDLASVISFLRTDADLLKPSEAVHPEPDYISSAIVKAIVLLNVYKPLPYEGKPITKPAVTDKVAYGRYLATDIYECATCHSASFETMNLLEPEKSPGFFGGGNPVPDEDFNLVNSANLTPSKKFGLGDWTEEQFLRAVKTGQKPDGTILKNQMPRLGLLADEELSAIWAYLQTVPVLENDPAKPSK